MDVWGVLSDRWHICYSIGRGGVPAALASGLRVAKQSVPADRLMACHAGPFAVFTLTASLGLGRVAAARRAI
jgi:hypothetical protein